MKYLIFLALCLITLIQAFSPDETEKFRQEALDQHNIFRKDQCAASLERSPAMDIEAQAYCQNMSQSGSFIHSGRIDYGETSYQKIPYERTDNGKSSMTFSFNILSSLLGSTPVIHWYQERVNYTVANPSAALHFTQLVWSASKLLGVGLCTVANNGFMVVALYFPRGNYENQFEKNVGCKK